MYKNNVHFSSRESKVCCYSMKYSVKVMIYIKNQCSHVQMRLTWVSGDKNPQQVQYANGKSQTSRVTTFSQDSMCSEFLYLILLSMFHYNSMSLLSLSTTTNYRSI